GTRRQDHLRSPARPLLEHARTARGPATAAAPGDRAVLLHLQGPRGQARARRGMGRGRGGRARDCRGARAGATLTAGGTPVSEQNVQLVRTIYELWARHQPARHLIDRELEYVNPPYAVEVGTRRGRSALSM